MTRLWSVFYNDDMKGRSVSETLDWCLPFNHYSIPPTKDKYFAFPDKNSEAFNQWMAEQYNACIKAVLPLPEELCQWWHNVVRKYGLDNYYPEDWNRDAGKKRWNKEGSPWRKAKETGDTENTKTIGPGERKLERSTYGIAHIVRNESEQPLSVSIRVEPHTSAQVTWNQ